MANQTALTGQQARFFDLWNGQQTLALLLQTIEGDNKHDQLDRGLGSMAEAVKYRNQHGAEIQNLLHEREPAINIMMYRLEALLKEVQDFRNAADTASKDVRADEHAARQQEIADRKEKVWKIFVDMFPDKLAGLASSVGSIPTRQQYHTPSDPDHYTRLREIAKQAEIDEYPDGFKIEDIYETLFSYAAALEATISESARLEADNKGWRSAWEVADGDSADLRDQVNSAAATIEELEAKIAELNSQPVLTETEVQLHGDLEEAKEILASVSRERDEALAQLERQEEELEKLKSAADTTVNQHLAKQEELEKQVNQVREDSRAILQKTKRSEGDLIDFFKKTLRHIVFKDVSDWRDENLGPVVQYMPQQHFELFNRPIQLLEHGGERKALFASLFDMDMVTRPSDFACLLVTCLTHDDWFGEEGQLVGHLLWLDKEVMTKLVSPATLDVSGRFMMSCMVSHLHGFVVEEETDALCSYWAATLLAELACRWKFERPRMLIGGLRQDTSSLPLLKAAGYLRLRIAAQYTAGRALRLSDVESSSQKLVSGSEGDSRRSRNESGSSQESSAERGEVDEVHGSRRSSQALDKDLPAVDDSRFVNDVGLLSNTCTLNTVDFFRKVCPANILGDNGVWYLNIQRGIQGLVAFAQGTSTTCFLVNGGDIRLTNSSITVPNYSMSTGVGTALWKCGAPGEPRSNFELQFNYGDEIFKFVQAFASDELDHRMKEEQRSASEAWAAEVRALEERQRELEARSGLR